MNLELSEPQRAALQEVLESYLSDLSVEIADTDRKEYRDEIKDRRTQIAGVLEALRKAGKPGK